MALTGKKVVIIGGSSGMGLATARAAAQDGAHVVIASRSADKLEQAKASISGAVETAELDAGDEAAVKSFFDGLGKFDHLVTTPGDLKTGPFVKLSVADAHSSFEGKFWTQYVAARYAAPNINSDGSITLFSGWASQRPFPNFSIGSAINAALEGLGRALALELAPVRVNVISPGSIDTRPAGAGPSDFYDGLASKLPVGRAGKPEDIAQTALYLMGNGYTTGAVLYVEGGNALV